MPQPIPDGRDVSLDFRPHALLQRPKLAPYIGAILMHWNEIESHMGIFLAALLGAEARTVMSVFLALQTDGGRKTTIDTVTKLRLSAADLARFKDIQKNVGGRYSERNKAAHGAWGISPHYPDDLVWYDPRETVEAFPDIMRAELRSEVAARMKEVNENVRIYNEKDFLDILDRFKSTEAELKAFTSPLVSPLFVQMNTRS